MMGEEREGEGKEVPFLKSWVQWGNFPLYDIDSVGLYGIGFLLKGTTGHFHWAVGEHGKNFC